MIELQRLRLRAQEIRQESGRLALFRASCLFLVRPVYQRNFYYLFERPVKSKSGISEAEIKNNTNDLVCKVVSSNEEADELERENLKFRSVPTTWNRGRNNYRRKLDKGAIAFCTFVGTEFAAIAWVIPSQKVQNKVEEVRLKVDYANHEAFPRGAWVNPKYRSSGLMRNTFANRDRFLAERGVKMLRVTVDYTNLTGKGMIEALDGKIYGRARLLRILWWRFWRETLDGESTKM
jgi:hypothetical protein